MPKRPARRRHYTARLAAVNSDLRKKLETFLLPLYQDLDGVSRFADVERISRIARRLHEGDDSFELLLLFQGLGKWLEKVGNVSRTVLAVGGITETDLWKTSASIRRLDSPETAAERAVAAAILIDQAGVRGLALKFVAARREEQLRNRGEPAPNRRTTSSPG